MRTFIKRNWIYFLVSFLVLCVILFGYLDNNNFFYIMSNVISDDYARLNFFKQLETESYRQIEPTLLNIALYILKTSSGRGFDATIILSTLWFQMIIPLFSIPACIIFYQKYHTIEKMAIYRYKASYFMVLLKEILLNALKLGMSIFIVYFGFILLMKQHSSLTILGAENRSLFSDIFGATFYQDNPFIYFTLEGFIRFFMVPFVYTCFGQAVVFLNTSLKYVVGSPIIYYYGLSAIGYALYYIFPSIAIYFNPTVLMANGSYDFNTMALLFTNFIPFYLTVGMVWHRCKNVEI